MISVETRQREIVGRNSSSRRPCESRGPYAAALEWGTFADGHPNNLHRWLWAPTFAGGGEGSFP
jgi:hypothetical protein